MKIESCPRIFSWPIYSSSARGRSVRSSTSSCGLTGAAAMRRSVSIIVASASRLGEHLQCLPDAIGDGDAIGQLLYGVHGFLVAVTQRDERVEDVGGGRRRTVHADRGRYFDAKLVLELQQHSLRRLLADARNLGKAPRVLNRHRLRELRDRQAGEHRQRGPRTGAAD